MGNERKRPVVKKGDTKESEALNRKNRLAYSDENIKGEPSLESETIINASNKRKVKEIKKTIYNNGVVKSRLVGVTIQ